MTVTLKRQSKTKQTIDAPLSVLDALPDRSADEVLQALLSRQTLLRNRMRESQARVDKIQQDLMQERSAISTERIAEALLENPEAGVGELQSLQSELATLRKTIEGLRRAMEQGEQEILNREAELDAAACRTVQPLHRVNVRATINAMLNLHRSIVTQDELRLELNRRDVTRTGQLQPFSHENFLTGAEDIHSWISMQLRELVYWKILTEDERLALQQGHLVELDVTEGGGGDA